MISAILLGDGLYRRPQWQVTKFRKKPLLLYPLEALQASGVDEIILVLGKDYHLILNKINIPTTRTKVVINRRFGRGLSSYLRAGIASVSPESEAVMVALGEFPLIKSSLIDRMLEFFDKDRSGILVPVFEKEIGQPFVFDRRYFKFIKRLTGNDTGESVIRKYHKDVHRMKVNNPGVVRGLESIEDLESVDTGEIDRAEREAATKDRPVPHTGDTLEVPNELTRQTREIPLNQESEEVAIRVLEEKTGKELRKDIPVHLRGKKNDNKIQKSGNVREKGEKSDMSLKMLNDLLGKSGKATPRKIERKENL